MIILKVESVTAGYTDVEILHEVNIKVLLGDAEAAGEMTRKQRDRLLEKMTDEVAEQCLRDNYLQSQAITVTHQLGGHLLDRFARFMRSLEKDGLLNRHIEYLPDDEEVLERMKRGYSRDDYRRLVARIRERVPAVSIATDVIVGFPSETEAQFQRTYDLLAELRLDKAHIARYSPRPQTLAARRFPDDPTLRRLSGSR